MRRRAPRPLSLSLERLRDDLAPASPLARVQTAWDGAVGAAIAAEARPVSLTDGVLVVECSASVWTAELTMMGQELCDRINAALGPPPEAGSAAAVVELRCRTR